MAARGVAVRFRRDWIIKIADFRFRPVRSYIHLAYLSDMPLGGGQQYTVRVLTNTS